MSIRAKQMRKAQQRIPRRSRLLSLALALSTASLMLTVAAPPASADSIAWGPGGSTGASDSAVTLRWDNKGNPADSTVSRAETAPLPHTLNKTVADIPAGLKTDYARDFGDLSVSISQTKNLVSQSVDISYQGTKGETGIAGGFLQIFQCWGAVKPDGNPDPKATSPDPQTCQVGAGGIDQNDKTGYFNFTRFIEPERELLEGGDWDKPMSDRSSARDKDGRLRPAPFRGIDGTVIRGETNTSTDVLNNPLFNPTTTNELSRALFDSTGRGTRTMEMQTGAEATGLGCGKSTDGKPSSNSCWLVVVPRLLDSVQDVNLPGRPGPLSPSIWAQRLQVKLDFQDRRSGCNANDAPIQVSGSEQMAAAMASWIPQICDDKKRSLTFNSLGETQLRSGFNNEPGGMMFGTVPVDGAKALYAPVGLTGIVVAYNIDLRDKNGEQATGLKLNARLVTKLLSQTYLNGIDYSAGNELAAKAPWASKQPVDLPRDPEFKKLNPSLDLSLAPNRAGDLLVENLKSDAVGQVWDWIRNDPSGRSFLSGCPDPNGITINPFFSTRAYQGCEEQKAILEKDVEQKIKATKVPEGFLYSVPDYSQGVYPQPAWYERSAVLDSKGEPEKLPLQLGDLRPRSARMDIIGRETARGADKVAGDWCDRQCLSDSTFPQPGIWRSAGTQLFGGRFLASITDAASAARYQLPTALLCDDSGMKCAGAASSSLQKAAAKFEPSGTEGVLKPAKQADDAADAYPLTLPVYAAVNPAGLSETQVSTYRALFEHIGGAGQQSGYQQGNLPPGYAPLTASMLAQLKSVATNLKAAPLTKPEDHPGPATPLAEPDGEQNPGAESPPEILPPPADDAVASGQDEDSSKPADSTNPQSASDVGKTSGLNGAWPKFLLLIGLGLALIAGLLAPVIGRRRRR